ncbi:RNA polymerase sigma factor, sigma-70 family protein [Lyngbya aestuarii BL J]|uniref:RNA polymerase sigma factor, sigma-70 family protein n=2 Tax=Lyngbya aestuarii TaxID=118322 RepID=U7QHX8_9CYAN|nr:RNA polymerase sigma factor, sigma-70 family protein [Lyngbya aestuarii BL J]
MQAAINPLPKLTEEQQLLQCLAGGEINAFWQLFQQYRDYLFRCCLKWTNGNSTEAEDLLSQAMLKGLEKAQKYAGKIENFKYWLITLTRNFWIDLKRRPCANQVEDIEVYGEREDLGWVAVDNTPGSALERDDRNQVIRAAIDELPTKMRETFILHFYEELSYQEIAERQGISYPNVCKRISQARGILVKELRGYFIEEKTSTEVSVTPVVIDSVIEETPLEKAGVEPILDEPMTLSVAVAEVECVVDEESPEVVVSEQESESDFVAVSSEGSLEEFKAIGKQVLRAVPRWLSSFGGSQLLHGLNELVWRNLKQFFKILVVVTITVMAQTNMAWAVPDSICLEALAYCQLMDIDHIIEGHCYQDCQTTGKSQFDKDHCNHAQDALPSLCKAVLNSPSCKAYKNPNEFYEIVSDGVSPDIGIVQPSPGAACIETGRVKVIYDQNDRYYTGVHITNMYPIKPEN